MDPSRAVNVPAVANSPSAQLLIRAQAHPQAPLPAAVSRLRASQSGFRPHPRARVLPRPSQQPRRLQHPYTAKMVVLLTIYTVVKPEGLEDQQLCHILKVNVPQPNPGGPVFAFTLEHMANAKSKIKQINPRWYKKAKARIKLEVNSGRIGYLLAMIRDNKLKYFSKDHYPNIQGLDDTLSDMLEEAEAWAEGTPSVKRQEQARERAEARERLGTREPSRTREQSRARSNSPYTGLSGYTEQVPINISDQQRWTSQSRYLSVAAQNDRRLMSQPSYYPFIGQSPAMRMTADQQDLIDLYMLTYQSQSQGQVQQASRPYPHWYHKPSRQGISSSIPATTAPPNLHSRSPSRHTPHKDEVDESPSRQDSRNEKRKRRREEEEDDCEGYPQEGSPIPPYHSTVAPSTKAHDDSDNRLETTAENFRMLQNYAEAGPLQVVTSEPVESSAVANLHIISRNLAAPGPHASAYATDFGQDWPCYTERFPAPLDGAHEPDDWSTFVHQEHSSETEGVTRW